MITSRSATPNLNVKLGPYEAASRRNSPNDGGGRAMKPLSLVVGSADVNEVRSLTVIAQMRLACHDQEIPGADPFYDHGQDDGRRADPPLRFSLIVLTARRKRRAD